VRRAGEGIVEGAAVEQGPRAELGVPLPLQAHASEAAHHVGGTRRHVVQAEVGQELRQVRPVGGRPALAREHRVVDDPLRRHHGGERPRVDLVGEGEAQGVVGERHQPEP
jgi:hypothetical protein